MIFIVDCGNILTGDGGIVEYPSTVSQTHYNHNISCLWLIRVPSSKVVTVQFTEFHLEGGGCHYDWLQV